MARIVIVPKRLPNDELHAVSYDPKDKLDPPPPDIDFGAYLYNLDKGIKKEIKWPYDWLRNTAVSKRLEYVLVREYDNGKTELRAMRDDGEVLLMWYDHAAVAVRRAYSRFIPRSVTRHILVKGRAS